MPGPDLHTLVEVRANVGRALDERATLVTQSARANATISALTAEAARAAAAGDRQAAEAAQTRIVAARRDRATLLGRIAAMDADVVGQVGRLGGRVDPADAEADVPLALFPVRLETRYDNQGATLRVRIYPDDIHVDQLDRGLSDDEQAAGRAYWSAIWPGDDAATADAAWTALVAQVHADRAAWVAHALRPDNLDQAGPNMQPAFPIVEPRARNAARARLLPDRFVAVALQNGVRTVATGAPVPPDVVVGLLNDDGSTLQTGPNGIVAPTGTEWIFDYDRALAQGMAITMPLARPNAPVDQLFVFGVRASLTSDRARAALEALLEAHRYSKGLGVVAQGTPTNNTESDRAGWQRAMPAAAPGRAPIAAPANGSNAAVIAAALGLDPAAVAGVAQSDLQEREQPRAQAANVALWAASWGRLLDSITTIAANGAQLTDGTREAVRVFFRDHVRGRGPIPALRVGSQPYGILPVSSVDARWRVAPGDPIGPGFVDLLRRGRRQWRAAIDTLPRVDHAASLDDTLLEILGSSPVLQGLRVRTVLSSSFADLASDATGGPADARTLEKIIDQIVFEDLVGLLIFQHPLGSLEKKSRPLPLPLVHATDPAFIDALLAGARVPDAQSVLQALLALSWDATMAATSDGAQPGKVGRLAQEATRLTPESRDRVVALQEQPNASAAALHAAADVIAAQVGEAGAGVIAQYSPIAAVRTSLGDLAIQATSDVAAAEVAPFALGALVRAQARRAELRDALAELRAMPNDAAGIDARRILVAETLDLASHRLDAWFTGLVDARRTKLRAAQPRGVMVGAYGWVEHLEPGGGSQRDGGFIHAPSLTHAATAGLLRSAYLTHNPDGSGTGAFAVDLTSSRVRVAVDLLDGMRQGQTLGALLGYRVERALHEARLDRLVLSLRALAPLVDTHLTTRGEGVPAEAAEAVAANNVVDGARLIDLFAADPAKVFAALDARPVANPYLGEWPALTAADRDVVTAAIRAAADASDAVADVVLAEGVHQLVQGNTARAAAALDGASSGDAPPIEPTVLHTPPQGVPFTHRVMAIVTGDGGPWNGARPRARAEPRLEAWVGARLGPPASVVVAVADDGARTTLDAAGLAALDVIYEAGDRARLERVIRAAIPAIPAEQSLARDRDPGWPADVRSVFEVVELAASLRELLVRARPAGPADFARASDTPTRSIDAGELGDAQTRAVAARDGLSAAADLLDAALQPPVNPGLPDDAAIATAIDGLAAYGVWAPPVAAGNLTSIAEMLLAEARRRVTVADAALSAAFDAQAAGIISQAIFGDGFWIVPAVAPPVAADLFSIGLGAGGVAPANGAIRRFIRDVASVRDAVARHAETLLVGDALGRPARLRVAQLAAIGTPGADRWVGGPLDPSSATPNRPITNLVLDAPDGYDGSAAAAALVIDQWVDVVPHREKRGDQAAADAPVDERVVSGLAVNAAAASARAPQAILLAISPDGARWTTDAIVDTLIDTLELAKIRAVTLERTLGAARVLPALYEQSWSLQGEAVLDIGAVATHPVLTAVMPYVKEQAP